MKKNLDIKLIHEPKTSAAVILFHGLTGSPFELKKMAKKLFESGFDVFAECLVGHGSNEIDIRDAKWQDWLIQAKNQLQKVKKNYENVFVGGLCLGSVIALALAAEYQNEIKGIIAISTTLFLDGWSLPFYKIFMSLGFYTIVKYFYTFPEAEPFGIKNQTLRKKLQMIRKNNNTAMDNYPLSAVFELEKLSRKVRKNLRKVSIPILIFHAKEDDLASTKSAKLVYQKINSQQKEYFELSNSYHLVILDNDKEFVFAKTIDFLTKRLQETNEALQV